MWEINRLHFFVGAVHLAGPIAKISKGLCKLSLAQCGLTAKGVNQIAHSLSLNQSISSSLTHLDLSGNNLKDEINVSNEMVCVMQAFVHYHCRNVTESLQLLGPTEHP